MAHYVLVHWLIAHKHTHTHTHTQYAPDVVDVQKWTLHILALYSSAMQKLIKKFNDFRLNAFLFLTLLCVAHGKLHSHI